MSRGLVVLVFLFFISGLMAQKEANVWVFGNKSTLDFNSSTPQVPTGSALVSDEACASIADENGDLLFYSDGQNVWDRSHSLMPNGTGLFGGSGITQGVMILPLPGNSDQYYLFTLEDSLHYSIVDMSLNGGLGDVAATKNVFLLGDLSEKMTSVKNCSNTGFWVIVHEKSSNFYVYELTSSGLSAPFSYNIGSYIGSSNGQLKASPNGDRLAYSDKTFSMIELFDFDNSTGAISNVITLPDTASSKPYGLEFSPDGMTLYASTTSAAGNGATYIMQFDLSSGSQQSILSSRLNLSSSGSDNVYGALQLGPDGKIYIAKNNTSFLSVIGSPDLIGAACNFVDDQFSLGSGIALNGLPSMANSFFERRYVISSDTSICYGASLNLDLQDNDPTYKMFCGASTSTCTGSQSILKVGNGLVPSTLSSPFHGFNANARIQYIYRATDLYAAGMTSPGIISSAAFDVSSFLSQASYDNFSLSLGCTSDSELVLGTWQTGLINVFQANITPNAGNTVLPFSANYDWDGISNIVVEVCYYTINNIPQFTDQVLSEATTYNSCLAEFSTGTLSACTNNAPTFIVPERPNVYFTYCTATGGVTNTYNWTPASTLSDPFIAKPVSTPTDTTLYKVVINDGTCSFNKSVKVNVRPKLIVDLGPDTSLCYGDSIVLFADSFAAYSWSGGAVSDTVFVSSSALYKVTVTDTNSCNESDSVFVHFIEYDIGPKDTIICFGDSLFLGVNKDVLNTYSWSTGSLDSSASILGLQKDTIRLSVMDTSQKTCSDSIVVYVNISESPIPDTLSACGVNTYALESDTGFNAYKWNTGSLVDTTNISVTGLYYLTVTDSVSCQRSDSVFVNFLSDSIIIGDTTLCNGDFVDLKIDTVSGISYTWSNGMIGDSIRVSPLQATNFVVSISDGSFTCKDSALVSVSVIKSILEDTTIVCGDISTILDPTNTYDQYLWSDLTTAQTLSVNSSGQYWVKLTDILNCTRTDTSNVFFISDTLQSLDTLSVCNGDSTTFILAPSSGLTYNWSTGETNDTIHVLPVLDSTIYVSISDGGATCYDSVHLIVGPDFFSLPDTLLYCGIDSVLLEPQVNFDQYSWSTGATTKQTWVDSTGVYYLTVEDVANCTRTDSVVISLLNAKVQSDTFACYNDTSILNAIGTNTDSLVGTYQLDMTAAVNVFTDPTIAGESYYFKASGTWSGAGSCENRDPFYYFMDGCQPVNNYATSWKFNGAKPPKPMPLQYNSQHEYFFYFTGSGGQESFTFNDSNYGDNSGILTFELYHIYAKAFSDVSYLWSLGSDSLTQPFVSDTSFWVYLSVTDTFQVCTDSMFLNIVPAELQLSDTFTTCSYDSVELVSAIYASYLWSTGDTDSNSWVDSTGIYYLTVTDSNGCDRSDSVLALLNMISPVNIGPDSTYCDNETILFDVGGFEQYLWNDNSTDSTLLAVVAGAYHVTVTDSNACQSKDTVIVSLKISDSLYIGPDTVVCPYNTVDYDLTGLGFSDYLWSTTSDDSLQTLSPGTYYLTVTDAIGCILVDTVNVNSFVALIDLGPDQTICRNDYFVLNAGDAVHTYLWHDLSTNNTIDVLDSGLYWVDVADTFGCITRDSVVVNYLNSPVLELGTDSSICPNTSYPINLTGFQYSLWHDFTVGPSYLVDDSLLVYVEAYDSFGCLFKDTLSISVDTSLKVDIAEDTLLCYGDTLILDAQNPAFSYFWQDSSITQIYNASSKGSYSVTVTDIIGCEQSDSMYLDMLDQRISPVDNLICLGDSIQLNVTEVPIGSVLLDSFTMSSSAVFTHITITTQLDKIYILKVSGDYSKTTGEQRDAAYIYQQGGNNISPIAELGFTWNGQNQLPQGANAYPSYSSDHEYEFGFAGNGLVQIISFSDGNYFDNTGSLHFELYEIGGSISWSTGDTSYHTMATPLNNSLYYVTVSNGTNICTDEVKVSVSKVISSVDSTKDLSCKGGADGLAVVEFDSGNGPYQVEWLNSAGDTIRSVSSPTITDTAMNLVAGNYTLYFTDTVLCVDSLTFSLSEPSLLLYQIMDTTMVACKSDTNGSITITPFGGTPGYTYSWFPATLPTDSIIDSLVAGIYEITITDAKGCDTSAIITITEPDTLKYSYIKYDDHCDQQNGTLDLSGVGGTSPFTFNTSGPGSTGVSGNQLTSLNHGDYYITITDANNCQYNDSLTLDSIPNPDATISYTSPSLCLDTPIAFLANSIPSNSSISSWIWAVDIDKSNPNPNTWAPIYSSGQNISYFYSDTGAKEIKLTVTDIHGCKDTDTVVINIYPLPVVDFYADTIWGCDTLSVSFYDRSQTIDTSTYYWDLGNSQTSTDTIAQAYYSQTGVYDVSLTVTNPYGCSNSKTIQDMVTVYKSPDAAFSFAPATTSNLGPPVDFFDASINAVSWSWNFGDTLPSSISNEQNPSHIYSDTGYMYIMLAIQSEETCKDTVYSSIYVKTYHSIFIPNVFTPNGDDKNDVFMPVGMLQGIDEYSMHIYNRWGDRIFHTEDKYTAWNGAIDNDPLKLCQNGAYVYFIVVRDNQGITTEYKGSVVLIADY